MNWGNFIKRTAVRRVVWIVVGLLVYGVLALVSEARAQAGDPWRAVCTNVKQPLCTEGEAALDAQRMAPANCARQGYTFDEVTELTRTSGQPGYFVARHYCRTSSGGRVGVFNTERAYFGATCVAMGNTTARINLSLLPYEPAMCGNGCEYLLDPEPYQCRELSGPGRRQGYNCYYEATPSGNTCSMDNDNLQGPEEDAACPAGTARVSDGTCKERGDCPVGQHLVNGVCTPDGACPTGHVKAPDGSCKPQSCGPGQARGADGTCKTDDNDDGTPDEDEETGDGDNKDGKKFSGGDSCDVPPTCSGDAIMCGQARIQWRIDCNTRRNANITGGSCSPHGMPICTGEKCDAVEHAQLIQQWKAACALDALLSQEGGPIGGGDEGGTADMDVGAVGEGAADGASGTEGDGGDPGGAFTDGSEGGGGDGELDTSGLGFGTSCPALPSINVLGTTLDFNVIGPRLCDWMTLGGYIVLILSSLLSLRILAGGMNV